MSIEDAENFDLYRMKVSIKYCNTLLLLTGKPSLQKLHSAILPDAVRYLMLSVSYIPLFTL